MSDTATRFVDPFQEDMLLAQAVFRGHVSRGEQLWFAQVLPILRKSMEGVPISMLADQLGIPKVRRFDFLEFLWRLAANKIIQPPWHRQSADIAKLTANYWLKETAMRQNSPAFYTTGYSIV